MTTWTFRWRLARLIAPTSIMADPFAGEDGVQLIIRNGGTVASFKADRFRMKSTTRIRRRIFDPDDAFKVYRPTEDRGPFMRFVGTVCR